MAKYKIADARTGLRPLSEKSICGRWSWKTAVSFMMTSGPIITHATAANLQRSLKFSPEKLSDIQR